MPGKADRVIGALRQMMGNRGAQRAERAFDEVPGLEKQATEKALIETLGDAYSLVAKIDPDRFKDLAVHFPDRYLDSFLEPHLQQLRDIKASPSFDGWNDIPLLELSTHDDTALRRAPTPVAQVTAHDGRHRSRVNSEEGVPSLVRLVTNKTEGPHGVSFRLDPDVIKSKAEAQEYWLQDLLLRELVRPQQGRSYLDIGHVEPYVDDVPGRERIPLRSILSPFRRGGLAQMRNC